MKGATTILYLLVDRADLSSNLHFHSFNYIFFSFYGKPVPPESFGDKNLDSSPDREEDGDDKVTMSAFFSSAQTEICKHISLLLLCSCAVSFSLLLLFYFLIFVRWNVQLVNISSLLFATEGYSIPSPFPPTTLHPMLCLGCIQVPGSEAEHENEEEEEQEEGSVISEQGPQNQDVRTLHVGVLPIAVKVATFAPTWEKHVTLVLVGGHGLILMFWIKCPLLGWWGDLQMDTFACFEAKNPLKGG